MKSEEQPKKSIRRHRYHNILKGWAKLQVRMTMSYVVVSVVTALLLELLVVLILVFVLARLPGIDQNNLIVAKGAAQVYALEAAVQANGGSLDPHSTLQSGSPFSLAVPEAISSNSQQVAFVLLISPNGQVLASSDPKRYQIGRAHV